MPSSSQFPDDSISLGRPAKRWTPVKITALLLILTLIVTLAIIIAVLLTLPNAPATPIHPQHW